MVLKAAISVMANGDIENGKAVMLDHLNSVIGFPKKEKFDCYGSEYDKCLQVFRAIWGTYLALKCLSKFCPANQSERFVKSYSFHPPTSNSSFTDQINSQFPSINSCSSGYCGVKFKGIPPRGSSSAQNSTTDVLTGNETSFYECRGQLLVQKSMFTSKRPWIIPFCISSLKGET